MRFVQRLERAPGETEFKTIPKLKEHLQDEWDALAKREKARQDRKRKLEGKSETGQSKKSRNDAS